MVELLMRRLARIPLRYPRTVILVSVVVTLVTGAFLPRLHVSTDRNLLAGEDNESFRHREEVNDLFGTSLVAVAVVTGQADKAEVRAVADELAAAYIAREDLVRDVFHRADVGFFEKHALLFLPLEKVRELPGILEQSTAGIELIGAAEGLPEIVEGLATIMEDSPAPASEDMDEATSALGFFGVVFDELTAWFEDPAKSELGLADALWSAGPSLNSSPSDHGYLTENDGEFPPLAVLFVQPASNSQSMEVVAPLTDFLRERAGAIAAKHPGVQIEVTGMPSIVTDEMRVVSRDCVVAGLVSGLGVLLVFMIAFRSVRVSLFLVLPLGIGLLWSAGLTALIYGHLTLITSYFAAVLFGLGVAFTIHVVARFHEALLEGASKEESVELALTRAGPGVVAGGGTTALAFGAIALSEFQGFSEMGVISGLGVTLILLTNLTTLPAALVLWHPGKSAVRRARVGGAFWVDVAASRIVVPALAVSGVVAAFVLSDRLEFDYAVENLLPSTAESVTGMKKLDSRTDFSMSYSIALSDTMEGAEELRRQFSELETVDRAESLGMFVPLQQEERIDAIEAVGRKIRGPLDRSIRGVDEHVAQLGTTEAEELAEAFQTLADTIEDMAYDAKKVGRGKVADALSKLVVKARKSQAAVAESKDDERARELERIIFSGLQRGLGIVSAAMQEKGYTAEDLPVAIRGRYVSRDGERFAVIVFPDGDIGEKEFFERHVAELLSVSQETTGHPVTHLEFTHMVHEGFKGAVMLAALAVVALILLDLRSPVGLAMALAPVLLGMGWTALLMELTGFKFNYANLMALPILIGTGVDYGVHLAHRARQEGSIRAAARTTGRAIALSGLTTLIGFGSLLLGQHWGVRSLGILLVSGITFSLAAALVVIPGVFRDKPEKKEKPVEGVNPRA